MYNVGMPHLIKLCLYKTKAEPQARENSIADDFDLSLQLLSSAYQQPTLCILDSCQLHP